MFLFKKFLWHISTSHYFQLDIFLPGLSQAVPLVLFFQFETEHINCFCNSNFKCLLQFHALSLTNHFISSTAKVLFTYFYYESVCFIAKHARVIKNPLRQQNSERVLEKYAELLWTIASFANNERFFIEA